MQFASPLPWWLVAALVAALGGVTFLAYRRPGVPLTRVQRGALIALRALVLAVIVFLLCRPMVQAPPAAPGDVIVPVLVDVSRSMRVPDADGHARIDRAVTLLKAEMLPAIARHGKAEVIGVGGIPVATDVDALVAEAQRTDLSGAVAAIRGRYRGRRVAGMVLLSDGGDTGQQVSSAQVGSGPPVFTI